MTMQDFKAGDHVHVRAHTSEPGKGLTYPAFYGTLLEDAGVSEGWDVVDVVDGPVDRSIYCFSIIRVEEGEPVEPEKNQAVSPKGTP